MASQFETWAREEIQRLKTEAEALERALAKYGESQRNERIAATFQTVLTPKHSGPPAPKPTNRQPAFRSKNQFVLHKIVESQQSGMTTQEVADAAEKAGVEIQRNSLRSLLWHNVKSRKVEKRGDKYYAIEGPNA